MNYDKRKKELAEGVEYVKAELEALSERADFGEDEQSRWDDGMTCVREAAAELARIERFEADQVELAEVATRAASFSGDGAAAPFSVSVRTDDPFDLTVARHAPGSREYNDDMVARAVTVVEESRLFVEDDHKQEAVRKIETLRTKGRLAEQMIAASSPAYRSAFARTACGEDLDPAEKAAMRQADQLLRAGSFFEQERSGMIVGDVTGKLVPAHLDPTVVLTNNGALNPLRGLARVESVSTNVWTGVSSDGIIASYASDEPSETSDDSPDFANPTVACHLAKAFVPISFQAFEDWAGGEAEIVSMIADAKNTLESVKFVTGSGSDEPFGIVTALDANTNVEVAMATNSAFTSADLFKLQEALPVRWEPNAQFLMNKAYINRIRAFGTNDSYQYTVDLTAEGIPTLLGKRLNRSEIMTGLLTTTTNNAIVYGDFRNYLIADRIGMVVQFVQNTFSVTNGFPMTQRGWLAHWRNGADSINDKGFRLLQNPAS